MNTADVVITGGRLVLPDGETDGAISVVDGRIAGVHIASPIPAAARTIDATGALVVPGAIDPHVHFRDPGFTEREDFGTGSTGAALGGVTTVLDMPNTRPATMSVETLEAKYRSIEGRSFVDFGLIAGVDASNVDAIPDLAAAGAAAFKIFMYDRRDPPPAGVTDDGVLLRILQAISETGLPAAVHAENDDLVRLGRAEAAASGRSDWAVHLDSRCSLAEVEAVSRAILFAKAAGARLHVCHISSGWAASIVAAAREGGGLTAEVTPQHLLLDSDVYASAGADALMVPPIRQPADRRALLSALLAGDIDMVATDHAPHTAKAKQGSPLQVATGLVGVQWSVPLIFGEVKKGTMTARAAVEVMSTHAAKTFGLYPRKGSLTVGADADIAVVDLHLQTLQTADLASRGKSTPFGGWADAARVRHVLVRGAVQVHDSKLVGQPIGRFTIPSRAHRPDPGDVS